MAIGASEMMPKWAWNEMAVSAGLSQFFVAISLAHVHASASVSNVCQVIAADLYVRRGL